MISGNIFTPKGFVRGMEHEPEVADLLHRLQTLTPQQSRVLSMLGEGLLNKQIAYELGVSEATIKAHVSAILLKLNVDSRTQAVIQLGKIGPSRRKSARGRAFLAATSRFAPSHGALPEGERTATRQRRFM